MDDSPSVHTETPSKRDQVIPWVVSLAWNTLLLIVIGVLIPVANNAPNEEPKIRSASIVQAKTVKESIEYFSDEDLTEIETASEDNLASQQETAPPLENLDPWDSSEAPLTAELALPMSPGLTDPFADTTNPFQLSSSEIAAEIARDAAERAHRNRFHEGEPAEISIFGSEGAAGHNFVFVIDRSKSMGGQGLGALDAARIELSNQLRQLKENHRFQIVAYHHETVMLGPRRMLTANDENISQVSDFIAGLGAYGGTYHDTALHVAISLEPDVIFLLTDGDEPQLSRRQLREIRMRTDGQIVISCIRFGFPRDDEGDQFMRELANQNGGSYRYQQMGTR